MNTKTAFMVVKIRFGRGPVVARRKGKNSGIATLAASLLTLIAICFGSLGAWRLCQDLGLAGDFVFRDGFLSHWQVWLGAAGAVQYACWRLTRYARSASRKASMIDREEGSAAPARVAANV